MWRGRRKGVMVVIGVAVGAAVLIFGIGGGSFGEDTVWVDFKTGELERRSSVLSVVVWRAVEPTEFSKVGRKVAGGAVGRDWHAIDVRFWFSNRRDSLMYGWVGG